MFRNKQKTKIHFVGIGGIGMSGIAEVLLAQGYSISGSDLSSNENTRKLETMGATIFKGHDAKNITDSLQAVVYTSAVSKDNPEIQAAKSLKIPTIRRAEMLAELMRLKYGIAVAGTHGKTTTSSILATILEVSRVEASYVIGGVVGNLKGHAHVGKGDFIVAEADESDGSFLLLNPVLSIITNIDEDHLDFYRSKKSLLDAFLNFANKVPFYGCCSLNMENSDVRFIRGKIKKPISTFGFKKGKKWDYEAEVFEEGKNFCFHLYYREEKVQTFKMNVPGRYNVLNALGAISIAHQLEISFEQIKEGVEAFFGVGRRFEVILEDSSRELVIVDDYAHHPTAIAEVIAGANTVRGKKSFVGVFEPHRFTRTRDCWGQFLHCFNGLEKLYLLPVYAASEQALLGIDSHTLAKDINQIHPGLVEVCESKQDLFHKLDNHNENTFVLNMGAGSIGRQIREYINDRYE